MDSIHITGVRTVSIPVNDQDNALRFSTGLGFAVLRDVATPNGRRGELAPGRTNIILTLEPADPDIRRTAIGIRFTSDDVDAAHAAMIAKALDVDDIMGWPGIPAMFAFRDLDGNWFSITGDDEQVQITDGRE